MEEGNGSVAVGAYVLRKERASEGTDIPEATGLYTHYSEALHVRSGQSYCAVSMSKDEYQCSTPITTSLTKHHMCRDHFLHVKEKFECNGIVYVVNEQFGSSLSDCMLDKCPVETLEMVARHLTEHVLPAFKDTFTSGVILNLHPQRIFCRVKETSSVDVRLSAPRVTSSSDIVVVGADQLLSAFSDYLLVGGKSGLTQDFELLKNEIKSIMSGVLANSDTSREVEHVIQVDTGIGGVLDEPEEEKDIQDLEHDQEKNKEKELEVEMDKHQGDDLTSSCFVGGAENDDGGAQKKASDIEDICEISEDVKALNDSSTDICVDDISATSDSHANDVSESLADSGELISPPLSQNSTPTRTEGLLVHNSDGSTSSELSPPSDEDDGDFVMVDGTDGSTQ